MFPYRLGLSGPTKKKEPGGSTGTKFPRIFAQVDISLHSEDHISLYSIYTLQSHHIVIPHGGQWIACHKKVLECVGFFFFFFLLLFYIIIIFLFFSTSPIFPPFFPVLLCFIRY